MKATIVLSADELVEYLKRTSLTTVLVEGSGDAAIYRWIEGKLPAELDVLICSGRTTLLRVFKRRAEFAEKRIIFMADQDMWCITGIPPEYSENVVFTNGYSIENDLYIAEVFEALLDEAERSSFLMLIEALSVWFAAEVEKFASSGQSTCGVHINQVCPINNLKAFTLKECFREPDPHLVAKIRTTYWELLRGKSLFDSLLRFLSRSDRASKFSRNNLMELGCKLENQRMSLLVARISAKCVV